MLASYHQRRDRWRHTLSCPAIYVWSGVDRPARLVDFQGAHFDRAKQRLKLSRPCLGPGRDVPLGHCAEGSIVTRRRVEADRRLVEYEHPRFVHQCPGDLEATAITAAQSAYLVALAAGEAKPVETDARPLARPPAGDAVERGKIEQILAQAEVEIERRLLEHDADPGQDGAYILGDVDAENRDPARPGNEQPGEQRDERRFAGAVWPDQRREVSG